MHQIGDCLSPGFETIYPKHFGKKGKKKKKKKKKKRKHSLNMMHAASWSFYAISYDVNS